MFVFLGALGVLVVKQLLFVVFRFSGGYPGLAVYLVK
jgi:hypothetical protein